MGKFAVIDTETNWSNQVMSIGTVIADEDTFRILDSRYHILTPEEREGGKYADRLYITDHPHTTCTRGEATADLLSWLGTHGVTRIFAYNARFDRTHLPELEGLVWHDIMRLAAYKQYNTHIPACAPCCKSGRLKSGYTVEDIIRMLTHCDTYCETHNAILDAQDELGIMRMLGIAPECYLPL